jgi:glycosyltransferase involved in cell wall biosynthesis
MRPRILYLSPPWPYRSIRSLHVARALQRMGEVEVVVVDSVCGGQGSVDTLGKEIRQAYELPVGSLAKPGLQEKIRRWLDPRFPFPHRIGVAAEDERKLLGTLREFDLVWIFKIRTANMFSFWRWPAAVLDVDDLPSGVYQTVARSCKSMKGRMRASWDCFQWKRRERLMGERFSVLTVCSEADKRQLNVSCPVHVVPSGFEQKTGILARNVASPPRFGFIGLFDYEPNVEGARWFIAECWPRIRASLPEARLRLVGRGSDRVFGSVGNGVDALGWVEDSDQEMATWLCMIVPLHVGGGTRVKIAEGFSRRCPIVSTSVGAFGYEVENGRHLYLADAAGEFTDACVRIAKEPDAASAMADRAHDAYLRHWTWEAIAPRIWAAAEDCLRQARRSEPA